MLSYIHKVHALYKTPSAGYWCSSQCTEPPAGWGMVHVVVIDSMGIHQGVCTEERLGSFGWMDQMLPCLEVTFIHLFTNTVPRLLGSLHPVCSSCSFHLLLLSCSLGSQSREHCLRILILRK